MSLYSLQPNDIADLLALVSSPSLTVTANNAARVAQLQAVLANAVPTPHEWHGCEECKRRAAIMLEELEVTRGALEASERERQEWIAKCAENRSTT